MKSMSVCSFRLGPGCRIVFGGLVAVIAFGLCCPRAGCAQDNLDNEIKHAVNSFLANRKKLKNFVWTFEIDDGVAQSWEEAKRFEFDKKRTLRGIWVVRGDETRYELLCPNQRAETATQEEIQQALDRGDKWVPVECASERILYDGHLRLSDWVGQRCANMWRNRPGPQLVRTPFSLGRMGEDEEFSIGNAYLTSLGQQNKEYRVYLTPPARSGGMDPTCVCVDFHFVLLQPDPDDGTTTTLSDRIWLSKEHGFMPVRTEYCGGTDTIQGRHETLSFGVAENGFVFPKLSVGVTDLETTGPFRMWVYRTLELKMRDPTDDELKLDFPKGEVFLDAQNKARSLRSSSERRVGPSQLKSLLASCKTREERIRQRQAERSQPAQDNESR